MKLFSFFALRSATAIRAARTVRPATMRPRAAMPAAALCVLAALWQPVGARAVTLDDALACNDEAHPYIQSLQDRRLIAGHPMHVEDDGLNVFWPEHDAGLTAFNMHVFAVLGYQQGDTLFAPGKGDPMDGSLYGVVVTAETSTVAKAIAAAGSPAEYKRAGPFLTAVYCRKH
ncbi:MAG TPA: hypothetical protein VL424_10900 [Pararobbsia sp.]|jgi:hypothetical protein|nr:hypothetical protein [Pararobbsia sp.]